MPVMSSLKYNYIIINFLHASTVLKTFDAENTADYDAISTYVCSAGMNFAKGNEAKIGSAVAHHGTSSIKATDLGNSTAKLL